MAIGTIKAFVAGPNRGTSAHPSTEDFEGATQTFKKGSPLVASGGYLIEATSPLTTPASLVGIADEPGENNAAAGVKKVRYMPLPEGAVFEGTLQDGGLTTTLVATDKFTSVSIVKDTGTGKWYLDRDTAAATDGVAHIVGFKDAVGATDPVVYFQVDAVDKFTNT